MIGSRAELEERAVRGLDQLQELHRPWIDEVPIRCEECGREVERIPEVGDAWLDAGIVHFSTLGWQNPEWVPEGNATGLCARADARRPSGPRVLGAVVPRRLGLGDARADPPLVLLPVLHGDHARRAAAVPARPHLREGLRRERSRDAQVVGERDRAERGARADGRGRHALALLRPDAEPAAALRLRDGRGGEEGAPHLLELGLVLHHVREHRRLRAGRREGGEREAARPLARRPHGAARPRRDRRVRALLDAGRHRGVRGLLRRSVQLVHPPLPPALLGRRPRGARGALERAHDGAAA